MVPPRPSQSITSLNRIELLTLSCREGKQSNWFGFNSDGFAGSSAFLSLRDTLSTWACTSTVERTANPPITHAAITWQTTAQSRLRVEVVKGFGERGIDSTLLRQLGMACRMCLPHKHTTSPGSLTMGVWLPSTWAYWKRQAKCLPPMFRDARPTTKIRAHFLPSLRSVPRRPPGWLADACPSTIAPSAWTVPTTGSR